MTICFYLFLSQYIIISFFFSNSIDAICKLNNCICYLPHLLVVPLPACENHSQHCTERGIEYLVPSSLQHVPESTF